MRRERWDLIVELWLWMAIGAGLGLTGIMLAILIRQIVGAGR